MAGSNSDKVLLVSYPKSGSNWVRYCIEYFSGQTTPGSKRSLLVTGGEPIIDRSHFLDKRHRAVMASWQHGGGQAGRRKPLLLALTSALRKRREREHLIRSRRILLLLRSPYELYVRTGATDPRALTGYLSNIRLFDLCRQDKILVYYEDMMKDFGEIVRILEFIGIDYDLASFDEAEHRQRSLAYYRRGADQPRSAGDLLNPRFHSAGLSFEIRSSIRSFCVRELGTQLSHRYLGRYH